MSLLIIIALLLDQLIGEPRHGHPLVGFGNIANRVEQKLNPQGHQPPLLLRFFGLMAWSLVVLPFVILIIYFEGLIAPYSINILADLEVGYDSILAIIILTIAIGSKSLVQHAKAVAEALTKNDIELARQRIAMIVSRDTSNSSEVEIKQATIESVLENGNDAVFAAIFFFVIFGAPGVVLYRLANTLDAMWGYRTPRYQYFGWASARIDDVLNWIPARLTAISYSLAGKTRSSIRCWLKQAKHWHGINPGVVMASGAGALQVRLGGAAFYHGQRVERPDLGLGATTETKDIHRAIALVQRSIVIWIFCIAVIEIIC
jgi:adenosylcobinamide-phosphate synthase